MVLLVRCNINAEKSPLIRHIGFQKGGGKSFVGLISVHRYSNPSFVPLKRPYGRSALELTCFLACAIRTEEPLFQRTCYMMKISSKETACPAGAGSRQYTCTHSTQGGVITRACALDHFRGGVIRSERSPDLA